MGVRESLAALAGSYVGYSASKSREQYLDLIAPQEVETPEMRQSMAEMSSCALVVRGLWRKMGCTHEILTRPYRIGRAMSDIVEIARSLDAWRSPLEDNGPYVGDAVIVGEDPRLHVFTIVEINDVGNEKWAVVSVDGGQGVKGAGILQRTRSWCVLKNALFDSVDPSPGGPGLGRPVYGYVDCTALGLSES
jgi:hypothetical protein